MVFRNVVGMRIKLFYYLYSFKSICKIHLFYIKIGLLCYSCFVHPRLIGKCKYNSEFCGVCCAHKGHGFVITLFIEVVTPFSFGC